MKYLAPILLVTAVIYFAMFAHVRDLLTEAAADVKPKPIVPPLTLAVVALLPANGGWSTATILWTNPQFVTNTILLYGTNAGKYDHGMFCTTNRAYVNLENGSGVFFQAISLQTIAGNYTMVSGESDRLYYKVPGVPRPIQQPK